MHKYNPYTKDTIHLYHPHTSHYNEHYNQRFNNQNALTPIYPYSKIQISEFPGRLRNEHMYHRSISMHNVHEGVYAPPTRNNFIHNIYEEQYNPYSRFGPKRYDDKKMKFNEKRHYDQYNKSCFYYNNCNSSLRKSLYSNFTHVKQDQFSYNCGNNNDDGNNQEQQCLSYRNVPIYKQKAVNFDIKPTPVLPSNRSNSVNNNNRIYYYNKLIGSGRGVINQYDRRSAVSNNNKNYYDNYTRDMKSDYKDNFIWYGKSRLGDKMYRYYYNEPLYRNNEYEHIRKPPVYYYQLK